MYHSKDKRDVRSYFIDLAKEIKTRKFLTLGGPKASDVKEYSGKMYKPQIISIERDLTYFKLQQKELRLYNNVILLNAELSNFLKHSVSMFKDIGAVFFDYTGIYGKSVEADLENLFKSRALSREIVFAITVASSHDKSGPLSDTRLIRETCLGLDSIYRRNKQGTISAQIIKMADEYNIEFQEVYRKRYKNKKVFGIYMYFFCFRGINRNM